MHPLRVLFDWTIWCGYQLGFVSVWPLLGLIAVSNWTREAVVGLLLVVFFFNTFGVVLDDALHVEIDERDREASGLGGLVEPSHQAAPWSSRWCNPADVRGALCRGISSRCPHVARRRGSRNGVVQRLRQDVRHSSRHRGGSSGVRLSARRVSERRWPASRSTASSGRPPQLEPFSCCWSTAMAHCEISTMNAG